MTVSGDSQQYPFWSYEDLALFVGSIFPSLGVASLIVRASRLSADTTTTLLYQSLTYALLMGVLYLLIARRYGQPFWRSLRWTGGYRGALLCVVAGPVLVVATLVVGVALQEPAIPSPFENLMASRLSLVILMVFVTILGPVFEEVTFRGFLFPLLARSLGSWGGILLTAALFALLHGSQYQWSWRHLVGIGLAGTAFGYARLKTQSTFAAALVHASYNTTLFVGDLFLRLGS